MKGFNNYTEREEFSIFKKFFLDHGRCKYNRQNGLYLNLKTNRTIFAEKQAQNKSILCCRTDK